MEERHPLGTMDEYLLLDMTEDYPLRGRVDASRLLIRTMQEDTPPHITSTICNSSTKCRLLLRPTYQLDQDTRQLASQATRLSKTSLWDTPQCRVR